MPASVGSGGLWPVPVFSGILKCLNKALLYSINVVNNNCFLLRWMLIKQSVVKTHDYVVVDNLLC